MYQWEVRKHLLQCNATLPSCMGTLSGGNAEWIHKEIIAFGNFPAPQCMFVLESSRGWFPMHFRGHLLQLYSWRMDVCATRGVMQPTVGTRGRNHASKAGHHIQTAHMSMRKNIIPFIWLFRSGSSIYVPLGNPQALATMQRSSSVVNGYPFGRHFWVRP